MKDYKDLNYKYLLKQKNRTLLTLSGIILSIGLIFSIMTFLLASREALIEEIKNIDGSYHGVFTSLEGEQGSKIKNHIHVNKVGVSQEVGSVKIEKIPKHIKDLYNIEDDYRHLKITAYDRLAIDLRAIKLHQGRLPNNPNEIVIESSLKEYMGINIGDSLDLEVDHRGLSNRKEYKLVGLMHPGYIWDGVTEFKGIVGLDKNYNLEDYDLYIELMSPKEGYEKLNSIADSFLIDDSNIKYNKYLLNFHNDYLNSEINKVLLIMVTLVISIIIFATIALIYNSFNMSVLERVHEFGILRSVGASSKQIKALILREGIIMALVGIPLGILFGIFLLELVFWIINILFSDSIVFVRNLRIILKKEIIGITSIIGFITIYISLLGPVKLTEKISPLESIRNIRDYKKYEIKGKKSKFLSRFTSIETQIACKNLERNKKRFRITVFSMTISIVLFIVFSNFINLARELSLMPSMNNISYEVYGNIEGGGEDLYRELKAIDGIEETYRIREILGKVAADNEYINNSEIVSIGENIEALKNLLLDGELDENIINSNMGVLLVKSTWILREETGKYELGVLGDYKVGDYIEFIPLWEDEELIRLKIIGILERGLFNKIYNYSGGLTFITTDLVFDMINSQINQEDIQSKVSIYLRADSEKTELTREIVDNKISSMDSIKLIDYEEIILENKIVTNFTSIFLYGFALIIAIIGGLNIVNTINTNIAFRTDEIQLVQIIGMTKKQVKKIIVIESILYGIYSSVIGVSIGFLINLLIYKYIFNLNYWDYFFLSRNILIIVLVTNLVSFFSGIYASNKAKIGSLLEKPKKI